METETKITELFESERQNVRSLELELASLQARISSFRISRSATNGSPNESFIRGIDDKIRKDEDQVGKTEVKLAEAKARHNAFKESLKILTGGATNKPKDLRPSSELAKVRDHLRKANKPLPLSDILSLIGKANDKGKYRSLRGTLRSYAKLGNIFTIASEDPHTFGLIEFNGGKQQTIALPIRRTIGSIDETSGDNNE